MKRFLNKNFLLPLLLIALSAFLVSLWFSNKLLIAGAEEGIVFYNPSITYNLFSSPWFEVGLGDGIPVLLPRFTMFFLPLFLTSTIHLYNWCAQAILLFFILVTALCAIYFLVRSLLGKKYYLIPFLSALFYLFNLYSQSQVIGRLLFTNIMGWAYFPAFFLLILLWISKNSWKALLLFCVASFFFSQTFGMPTFVITLWMPVVLWFIYFIFLERPGQRSMLVYGMRLLGIGITWVMLNIWWLTPYIKLSSAGFSPVENFRANLDSLQGVSAYFPTSQILILRQLSLFPHEAYYDWYATPYAYILSILVLVLVAIGIVTLRKSKIWIYLIALLIVGWTVSKGTNPPFGHLLFSVLFQYIPPLQAFRNSYEKFGIVFLFPYAIFFSVGLQYILGFIQSTKRYLILGLSCFLFFGILVWPMWSGDVFGASVTNARVEVPQYYAEANAYLNLDQENFRVVVMPLINGDSVRYFWPKGYYQGINPSEFLFEKSTISKILRAPYTDDKYEELYSAFTSQKNYVSTLNDMNVKYIVVNEDLDWKFSGASPSAVVEQQLASTKGIVLAKHIGKLAIYRNTSLRDPSLFQVSNSNTNLVYKKISPTHYVVFVSHVTSPAPLIFKETYNPLWQAEVSRNMLSSHVLALNYANSWLLTKTGSYTIDVVLKIWPWE